MQTPYFLIHENLLDENVMAFQQALSKCWPNSQLSYSVKTNSLGYEPEYDFVTMMKDFKREMVSEPMAKLWGTGAYYDDLYKDQV